MELILTKLEAIEKRMATYEEAANKATTAYAPPPMTYTDAAIIDYHQGESFPVRSMEFRRGGQGTRPLANGQRTRPHTNGQETRPQTNGLWTAPRENGGRHRAAPNNRGPAPTTSYPQPMVHHSTQRPTSENPDFQVLVRKLFAYVQLRRANQIWSSLPKGVDNLLGEAFGNILPPMPNESIHSTLARLGADTKTGLLISVQEHLTSREEEIRTSLSSLNPRDKLLAAKIARTNTIQRYGQKINPDQVYNWMGEALDLVGTGFELPHVETLQEQTTGPAPIQTIITPARGEGWHRVPQGQRKRKLRTLITPPPVVFNNRFGALPLEGDLNQRDPAETPSKRLNRRQSGDRPGFVPVSTNDTASTSFDPQPQNPIEEQQKEQQQERQEKQQQEQQQQEQQQQQQEEQQEQQQHEQQQEQQQHEQQQEQLQQEEQQQQEQQQEQLQQEQQQQQQEQQLQQEQQQLQQQQVFDNPPDSPNSAELASSSPRLSASQPAMTIGARPVVHNERIKSHWSLKVKPQTKTVVIADSNFRLATQLPADWEVHVYPGMSLIQTCRVIESSNLRSSNNLQHVIFNAGINNRGWTFSNVLIDFNKVCSSIEKTGCTGHFVGISIPPEIPDYEKETIRRINNHAKGKLGNKYIQQLSPDQVSVSPTDKFKIHYDHDTIFKICDNIVNHFLSLTDFRYRLGRQSL